MADASPKVVTASLSARRAWIEILLVYLALIRYLVALRKESVDRNTLWEVLNLDRWVALRKESVDRNLLCGPLNMRTSLVALRKESVDRN